ncbi:hypothetical protein GOP47_0018443 [Adiantum capillus-veneris]|uniref:RNA-binding S4 domain-containing protein n=1 Tax=Adiantum capillus-veneris TaxID=13818 RepID=A0A9D4UEG5_ADICA|nr:hypothetical protein GOP47_0018443 [Adiantum capillus-veneris]
MQGTTTGAGVPCVSVLSNRTRSCYVLRVVGSVRLSPAHRRIYNTTSLAIFQRDEKKDLLAGVHRDHMQSIARIVEQAKTAAARWEIIHSDFLTPPAIEDASRVLRRLSDVGTVVSGGYPQAERCRLSLGHKEAFLSSILTDNTGYPGAVVAVSILGDFMVDRATHSDFLGSILGTGIAREKIGDILVQGDTGAQAIIVPELIDFLETSLTQVRKTPVLCKTIPLKDIHYQPPRLQITKSVEASLRVDAVASAGFKISRSKLADLISAGDVRVNWKEVTKNGLLVKSGDIISVNQKGRVEVGQIGTTRKGRYHVELLRYM